MKLFRSLSLKPISRMAKEESVFCGQVLILISHSFYFHAHTYKYIHILYLNTIRFNVQSLWGPVKLLQTNGVFKIGMTLITK